MDASEINLVAVQCYAKLDDFLTASAFETRIRQLADKVTAALAGSTAPTVVVFPEMLGTFLALVDHQRTIEGARTTDEAMRKIAMAQPFPLLGSMFRHRTLSLRKALLLMLAPRAYEVYHRTFSTLARERKWYVVGGSLLVPRNADGDDAPTLHPLDAQLYNSSYTFDPSGRCLGVTRKVNLVPTQEDVLELTPGAPSGQPLMETPGGRLAVAICYDGFNEPHTGQEPGFVQMVKQYDNQAAIIVACPSANPWPWEDPWVFHQGDDRPTRREQWEREGLQASMRGLRNVRYGVNAMLLGRLLDHTFDGRSQILGRKGTTVEVLAAASRADASAESEEIVAATVPALRTAGVSLR